MHAYSFQGFGSCIVNMQEHITMIWGQTQQISTFDSYAICGACALMSDIHHTFQDKKCDAGFSEQATRNFQYDVIVLS